MAKRVSDTTNLIAAWQAKRDKTVAEQKREQAENERRLRWQQAHDALVDSESNVTTRLGRRPRWEEMTHEYASCLCAWVTLWDGPDVSALAHLPPLSPEEEQFTPGITEARHLAILLANLAGQGKQREVRELFDQLRDDHLDDNQAREDMRELRRLVLLWLHFRLHDVLRKTKQTECALETPAHSAAAEPPSPGGNVEGSTVDAEDERILRALAKDAPHRLTQDEIASASRVSRRTISARMRTLLHDGLVAQPKGPKRGTTIGESGLKVLKQIDATKLAR